MFDLGWSELLLVSVVALVVIGPKDLPAAMRQLGKWVGKARAMTRHVRAGFDEMVRQAELEEMEKEWREHNKAIMAATPDVDPLPKMHRAHLDEAPHAEPDPTPLDPGGGVAPAVADRASPEPPRQEGVP